MNSLILLAYRIRGGKPKLRLVAACAVACVTILVGASREAFSQAPVVLRVAAASDLQPVMPVFAAAYEKAKGVKLLVSYGSSSTLATQIVNGAPVDLFLSADYTFAEKVVAVGLADSKSPIPYAKGALALWARKDSKLQPISMETLIHPGATSIAIADEIHAPYGRAAASALRKLNLYDQVKPHLVVAKSIGQAGQFVESGNAQLGLISLTLASSPHFKDVGSFVLVPSVYPEIRQCAVVMARSSQKIAAHTFLDWILSSEIQGHLKDFGLAAVQ